MKRESRNQAAFKQLVGDRSGHSVDERLPHLWIATKHLYRVLFHLRFWLLSLLVQLLATRLLVLLYDSACDPIKHRILLGAGFTCKEECEYGDRKRRTLGHDGLHRICQVKINLRKHPILQTGVISLVTGAATEVAGRTNRRRRFPARPR
jgi:hypothetical protein